MFLLNNFDDFCWYVLERSFFVWYDMISDDFMYILDARSTWLNQGWKNTPLPLPEAFEHKDGIITVVDAKHCLQHLHEEKPEGVENEAVEQLAFADRIIVNKTDLVRELSWNVAKFPQKPKALWMDVDGLMSFVIARCMVVQIFGDFPTSFGDKIAVHRSQRPSFQSSLERFERSMVLHPWSTLRAMFAGWIVAAWYSDSEISRCRAILKIMLESKAVSKSEKGCRQWWTQQKLCSWQSQELESTSARDYGNLVLSI